MTFEEKRTLSLNINKLSQDKLVRVVTIIKKKKKVNDDEEMEIDIDSLSESTLRELEKYVNDCLNPPKAVCLLSPSPLALAPSPSCLPLSFLSQSVCPPLLPCFLLALSPF